MTEQTIVIEANPNPSELPGVQEAEIVEAQIEAVETVSETAVEIAEIEAETTVAVAEINAAVEIAHIEARADERNLEEENQWLRNQMNLQEQRVQTLEEQMANLLTPPLSLEEAEEIVEILTPPSTLDAISETQTEAIAESGVESQVVAVRRRIAI